MPRQWKDGERATQVRALYANNLNNGSNANGNNNLNNNARFLRIAQAPRHPSSQDLYSKLCSYENLTQAYRKARRRKTLKPDVIEFEKDLEHNLLVLRSELLLHAYRPRPLQSFIIRDPKTRIISKSAFRDRVIHHALCTIIEPIFDKTFIDDSYANRKGKGTLKAIARYQQFTRRATRNFTRPAYALKADIRHYFDTVSHERLLGIIGKRVDDERILWLVRKILGNYSKHAKGIGMPLGNLTSQFFANVYLNELDQYVKHSLKARNYIRYVDDFVIIDGQREKLEEYKENIGSFLQGELGLTLHPEKSRITAISRGICFLGFRVFPRHMLPKKQNIGKFKRTCTALNNGFERGTVTYDRIYDFLEGWVAYAMQADTRTLRRRLLDPLLARYGGEVSSKEEQRIRRIEGLRSLVPCAAAFPKPL